MGRGEGEKHIPWGHPTPSSQGSGSEGCFQGLLTCAPKHKSLPLISSCDEQEFHMQIACFCNMPNSDCVRKHFAKSEVRAKGKCCVVFSELQ